MKEYNELYMILLNILLSNCFILQKAVLLYLFSTVKNKDIKKKTYLNYIVLLVYKSCLKEYRKQENKECLEPSFWYLLHHNQS